MGRLQSPHRHPRRAHRTKSRPLRSGHSRHSRALFPLTRAVTFTRSTRREPSGSRFPSRRATTGRKMRTRFVLFRSGIGQCGTLPWDPFSITPHPPCIKMLTSRADCAIICKQKKFRHGEVPKRPKGLPC